MTVPTLQALIEEGERLKMDPIASGGDMLEWLLRVHLVGLRELLRQRTAMREPEKTEELGDGDGFI